MPSQGPQPDRRDRRQLRLGRLRPDRHQSPSRSIALLAPLGNYGGPTQTMALCPAARPSTRAISPSFPPASHRSARRTPHRQRHRRHRRVEAQVAIVPSFVVNTTADAPDLLHRRDHAFATRSRLPTPFPATPSPSTRPSSPTPRRSPDRRPARAERHERDRDDHGPGGGRDDQRRRAEPGVPGRRGVTASLSGLTITGGKASRRRRRRGQPRHDHARPTAPSAATPRPAPAAACAVTSARPR